MTCLVLMGCETQKEIDFKTLSPNETAYAAREFSEICLNDLPSFKGFKVEISKRGLASQTRRHFTLHYEPKNETIGVLQEKVAGTEACGVAFLGTKDIASVSRVLLKQATKKLGKPKRHIPHHVVNLVLHMQNGSALYHVAMIDEKDALHLFIVTSPVPEEQIRRQLIELM